MMDIAGYSPSMTAASGARVGDSVAIPVQKKAMEIQQSQAQQLIESVEKSVSKPQGKIDVYA